MVRFQLSISEGTVTFSNESKVKLGFQSVDHLTPGDVCLVTGNNGSGKSTLLRIISNVWHYDDEIKEHSLNVKALTDHGATLRLTGNTAYCENGELRVGFVSQAPRANFIGDSLEAELRVCLEHALPSSSDVETRLDELRSTAESLGFPLEQKLDELSDGRLQLLAVLLQMWLGPEILVLDEPTAALDDGAVEGFARDVSSYVNGNDGHIILISTQDQRLLDAWSVPVKKIIVLQSDEAIESEPIELRIADASHRPSEINLSSKQITLHTNIPEQIPCSFNWVGGQVVQIIGSNGIGKTTLLEAISGFDTRRTSGKKTLNGVIHDISSRLSPPQLAYCFQNAVEQIIFDTARSEIEYLDMMPSFEPETIRRTMRSFDLDVSVARLSQGQQKFTALLSMIGRSYVFLADEPFNSLDTEHRDILMSVFSKFVDSGGLLVLTESRPTPMIGFSNQIVLLLNESGLQIV